MTELKEEFVVLKWIHPSALHYFRHFPSPPSASLPQPPPPSPVGIQSPRYTTDPLHCGRERCVPIDFGLWKREEQTRADFSYPMELWVCHHENTIEFEQEDGLKTTSINDNLDELNR
ncbi:hypothetical protein P8452_21768 [Trifolium repens]|nr:hypothetical protein P8452_21768 [Trifolium repens]